MLYFLFDYVGYLLECFIWSEDESVLYWIDILEQEIYCYYLVSGMYSVLVFLEEVGCFVLCEQGGFIVVMCYVIWLVDKNGLLQCKVCDNFFNMKLVCFNDGGIDGDGCFYVGMFWVLGDYNGVLLMWIDYDLMVKVIQCGIQGYNGLVFSLNNQWMYIFDMLNGVIYCMLFDKYGELGKCEFFCYFGEGEGFFDGVVMDSEGCYWSVMFDGWCVVCFLL